MLIFENVLFEALFQNVAKSVGWTLGFFYKKKMGKVWSNCGTVGDRIRGSRAPEGGVLEKTHTIWGGGSNTGHGTIYMYHIYIYISHIYISVVPWIRFC